MDVSRDFTRSKPLKRNTYVKLPEGADQENAGCELLKPLYGLSTTCKDWYRTIGNFLTGECGGKAASLDKSVFSWEQEGISYEYGRRYRDPNKTNLDKNEFEVNGISQTRRKEQRWGSLPNMWAAC